MAQSLRLRGLKPVPSDDALPQAVDVAIIGGGIVGAMAALTLAEQGKSVALFEKGEIGAEQSGRNWGWVRKMGRQASDIQLAILADEIWPTLNQRTGETMGHRVIGSVYPCDTQEQIEAQRQWRDAIGRPAGVDSRLLDAEQTAALLPGCARPFKGALHTPSDACAEPFLAAPGIALGARRAGAQVFTNTAVRGLERSAGRVTAVVSERGTVACEQAILASGAWSGLFLRHHGLRLPQLRMRGSVAQVEGMLEAGGAPPDICCSAKDLSFRKRIDGTWTFAKRDLNATHISPDHFRHFFDFLPTLRQNREVLAIRLSPRDFLRAWREGQDWEDAGESPFERTRSIDPPADEAILSMARASLLAAFPAFETATPVQSWAGDIDGTPDALPVIGPAPGIPGLTVATGFSGHGFGIGPAAGQIAAELAMGKPPSADISAFRMERF